MKNLLTKFVLTSAFTLFCFTAFASEQLIINSEDTFNPTHENRFSFMMGMKPSASKTQNLTNFTFSYGKKLDNFWLDTSFMMTKGLFREMSANNPVATTASDFQLEEQKNSLTTIGVGIGRETRYAQTLLPFSDIYEFMAANLTYNMYKEDFSGKTFNGPGILTKFSVYKKFNDYFSAGAHFNYSLAVVKRAAENDTENSSDRSLTLGFLAVGFDVSFYL